MARPLRIEYAGAWYHVMNRGLGRREIFSSDGDRKLFMEVAGETAETFKLEIHAYSLMDNHYHLLVHTPEGNLSRCMRHLNGVYTQKFNRRHCTDGPLFRGRYKALLVESDEYLLELVRYIHLNPVETGICRKPEDHRWTSHSAYLNDGNRPDWLVRDEVLGRFGKEEKRALKEMHAFVCEGVPLKFKRDLREMKTILGTRGFQEWVYGNFADEKGKDKEIPKKERKPVSRISPKQIMDKIAFAYGVGVSELRRSRRGESNEARNVGIYLTRKKTGMKQREIAKWFNCGSEYAVATVQRRLKGQLERNRNLRKKVVAVERTLWS